MTKKELDAAHKQELANLHEVIKMYDAAFEAVLEVKTDLPRMRTTATLKQRVHFLEETMIAVQLLLFQTAKGIALLGVQDQATAAHEERMKAMKADHDKLMKELRDMVKVFQSAKTIGQA
jgi:hypothetical protein